MPFVRKRNCSF